MGAYLSTWMTASDETVDNNTISASPFISEADVLHTQDILLSYLPFELVDVILDLAMYWPRIVAQEAKHFILEASKYPSVRAKSICLITPPIPSYRLKPDIPVKVKMVRFTIESHDQGWGGDDDLSGSYVGSWTWFEATITRPGSELLEESDITKVVSRWELNEARLSQAENPASEGQTWLIQRNVRASRMVTRHEVVWMDSDNPEINQGDEEDKSIGCGKGTGFVRSLAIGDRIAITAHALFPGWENHVYGVKVEIFYSM